MAYFYVSSVIGTATGDGGRYATQQTGSFAGLGASGVYASLTAAFNATTAPGGGDYILISDSHAASPSELVETAAIGATDATYIITVSNTAIDTATIATSVQENSSADLKIGGRLYLYGVYFKSGDDLGGTDSTSNTHWYAEESTFHVTGNLDSPVYTRGDGGTMRYLNCEFISDDANGTLTPQNGAYIECRSCTFTGFTNQISYRFFISGGATLRLLGCDLSDTTGYLLSEVGSGASVDDTIDVLISNCNLNASLTGFVEETFENYGQRVTVVNSGSDSAVEYQYHITAYGGTVDDATSIYRTDSTAFESGQKISLKCVTNSNASRGMPFWFDYPARLVDFSSGASDVLKLYMLTTTTLTDADVWAALYYPDGTSTYATNVVNTQVDPLSSGSTLTTNSESWSGYTSQNRYEIELDTSGDAGDIAVANIRVYVAKASTTIYFCPTIGLS